MRKLLGYVVVFALGMGVGVAVPEQGGDVDAPDRSQESQKEGTEPPRRKGSHGDYALASCALDRASTSGTEQELVGSTRVENTGSVPLRAEVSFSWLLKDGASVITQPKRAVIAVGGTKLVSFSEPVSEDQASGFQSHPDYPSGENCTTAMKIL